MNCPNCNQCDTQKVSVAYQMGTTSINSSTMGYAGGRIGGQTALGLGISSSSAIQQNIFVKSIKPPEKQRVNGAIGCLGCFGIAIISLIIGMIIMPIGQKESVWGVCIIITGAVFAIFFAKTMGKSSKIKKQRADVKWRNDMIEWEKQWVCLRCGGIFIPERGA